MKGYAESSYREIWRFVKDNPDSLNTTWWQHPWVMIPIRGYNKLEDQLPLWVSLRGELDANQAYSIIEALRRAVTHEYKDIQELRNVIIGSWNSGYGSGATTYSSINEKSYYFRHDHTFSYNSKSSATVCLPPVGTSSTFPLPEASTGSSSSFHETGIFFISSPEEILLVSDKGRCSFSRIEVGEGTLRGDLGTFWRS